MSGGQQGGPMMGGGKGGTQQMPAGGGKGGPQGQMMPNGQRQQRPGMGGPMSGNMGQPQRPGISSWQTMTRPGPGRTELGGFGPSMPQTYPGFSGGGMQQDAANALGSVGQQMSSPQANFGMSQGQQIPAGYPRPKPFNPSQIIGLGRPQPGSYPQDQGPSTGMIGGQPAQFHYQAQGLNQGQPQQQPRQLSGLLAKLYGG